MMSTRFRSFGRHLVGGAKINGDGMKNIRNYDKKVKNDIKCLCNQNMYNVKCTHMFGGIHMNQKY